MNKMKLRNKDKTFLLLKFLLVFCFHVTAHKMMNVWVWNQLKDQAKTLLKPEQTTFVNTGEWGTTSPCPTSYPHPDAPSPCGDAQNYNHMSMNHCKTRAATLSSNIPATIPTTLSNVKKVAHSFTAALHYVADMACPVHNPNISGNASLDALHAAYESAAKSNYTFDCTASGSCPSYADFVNRIPEAESRLNSVTTSNGNVFELTNFYHYNNGRYVNWKSLYDQNKAADLKVQLLQDIAYACCVLRRFWKGNNNMKNWFN